MSIPPELPPDQPQPPLPAIDPPTGAKEPLIRVLYRHDLGEFDFLDEQGGQAYPTTTSPFNDHEKGMALLATLVELQFAAGRPGTYDARELAERVGSSFRSFAQRVAYLSFVVPPSVVAYRKPSIATAEVIVGNFVASVALEPSTEEARATYPARHQVAKKKFLQGGWEASMAGQRRATELETAKTRLQLEDPEKASRMVHDHAIFRLGGEYFYIDFNSPANILLARTLEGFANNRVAASEQTAQYRQHRYRTLQDLVWRDMPLAERRLFIRDVDRMDDIYRGSEPIAATMGLVFETLCEFKARGHSFARPYNLDSFHTFPLRVEIEYHDEPPEEPYVFPRITAKKRQRRSVSLEGPEAEEPGEAASPTDEEVSEGAAWLERIGQPKRLSHREAIDLLDLVTSPLGRLAIYQAAGVEAGLREELIDEVHEHIRRGMGGGAYWPAWRQRTIAGEIGGVRRKGSAVRMVSGRLPGDTRATVTDEPPERA